MAFNPLTGKFENDDFIYTSPSLSPLATNGTAVVPPVENKNTEQFTPWEKESIKRLNKYEGFRPDVYKDETSHDTIGAGFNISSPLTKKIMAENGWDDARIKQGKMTREESDKLLAKISKAHYDEMLSLNPGLDKNLNDDQKVALNSLYYNSPKLLGSNLKKALMDNNLEAAGKEIAFYSNKNKSPGLLHRRLSEASSFADLKNLWANSTPEEKNKTLDIINKTKSEQLKKTMKDMLGVTEDVPQRKLASAEEPVVVPVPKEEEVVLNPPEVSEKETLEENPVQKTQTLLDQYKELLNRKSSTNKVLDAMSGTNKIAQAIASGYGARIDDGSDIISNLKRSNQQDVEDFLSQGKAVDLQSQVEMSDPNSDISKFARERSVALASKIGMSENTIKSLEDMSAAQLQKLGLFSSSGVGAMIKPAQQTDYETKDGQPLAFDPVSKNYINIMTQQPYFGETRRKITSNFVDPNTGKIYKTDSSGKIITELGAGLDNSYKQQKTAEGTPVSYMTRKDLTPNDKKLLDDTREKLSSNVQYKNAQEAVDGAENALALLDMGKTNGQDLVRAVQVMLAKSSGQVGVLTEQDVQGFGGRDDLLSRLNRTIKLATSGKLPEGDRKFLKDFATTMKSAGVKNISQVSNQFSKQLSDDLGVSSDNAKNLLNIKERLGSTPAKTNKQDSKVEEYAKQHKLSYGQAKAILIKRGYTPNEQ